MNERRVAVVTGIPAPYREPVFSRLAQRPGIDLRVFYCAKSHQNVAWQADHADADRGYPCDFLPNWTPKRWQRLPMFGYANVGIYSRLKQFDPDFVIVYGYNQLSHWLTFLYCQRHGIPFAMRSDSNRHIDTSNTLQSRLRRRLLSRLVQSCSAILAVGTANRDYWLRYGIAPERIFLAPFAIDNERVASLAKRNAETTSRPLRFMYAGRLIPRKGVDRLLQAFNQLCETHDVSLSIIGDGPLRDELMALQSDQARSRTTWHGRVANEKVFECFAEADVFVLPSLYEPWGLVVNEAMAAGLPIIADRRCGAAIDLVEDGRTGRVLSEVSVQSLHAAMRGFADKPESATAMGIQARQKIEQWSFDHTVDGFVKAIKACARQRGEMLVAPPQEVLTVSGS